MLFVALDYPELPEQLDTFQEGDDLNEKLDHLTKEYINKNVCFDDYNGEVSLPSILCSLFSPKSFKHTLETSAATKATKSNGYHNKNRWLGVEVLHGKFGHASGERDQGDKQKNYNDQVRGPVVSSSS